jgi:hypothetical protein
MLFLEMRKRNASILIPALELEECRQDFLKRELSLNPDTPYATQDIAVAMLEKKARNWDRWVTLSIVFLLILPLPFVRFEAWPQGTIVFERIIMPWSRFQICYVDYVHKEPVVEEYRFTWKGELLPRNISLPLFARSHAVDPPLLKWQNNPDIVLKDIFYEGDFLQIKTFWRPILLWPFAMGFQIRSYR